MSKPKLTHKEQLAACSGCVISFLVSYLHITFMSPHIPNAVFFIGMAGFFWLKSLYHGVMIGKKEE